MNKVILNPKFSRLSDFINQLPDSFATAGQTVYQARNVIKVFEKEGFRLNVKSYHIPIFINQIIYSFCGRPRPAVPMNTPWKCAAGVWKPRAGGLY